MQGLKRLQSAIERHRENKDINIKYKTPLTSEYIPIRARSPQHPKSASPNHFCDLPTRI